MEAEYQACSAVAREALSLRKALGELSQLSRLLPRGALQIRGDNQAALTLCGDRKEGQRIKHIDIIHHFVRERVESGEIAFTYCRSADNASDLFTKALPHHLFEAGLKSLGCACAPSLTAPSPARVQLVSTMSDQLYATHCPASCRLNSVRMLLIVLRRTMCHR